MSERESERNDLIFSFVMNDWMEIIVKFSVIMSSFVRHSLDLYPIAVCMSVPRRSAIAEIEFMLGNNMLLGLNNFIKSRI